MEEHFKFKNKPLPYEYNALEPYIDTLTMRVHHDRHLQAYIDNLNKALSGYPQFQNWPLERLIYNANMLPSQIRTDVINNAGGVFNHFFFFDSMTPNSAKSPQNKTVKMINSSFSSYEAFEDKFTQAALSVFGSGYSWLVENKNMRLMIITTPNQITPLPQNYNPLLCIDVWEHAYYLKHLNQRAGYISDWFNVINWDMVEKRLG